MNLNPISSLKSFWDNARHVMSISYKPGMQHFQKTLKIVLIGTIIVGVLGYVISIIIGFII